MDDEDRVLGEALVRARTNGDKAAEEGAKFALRERMRTRIKAQAKQMAIAIGNDND